MSKLSKLKNRAITTILAIIFLIVICPFQTMASQNIDQQLIDRGYPNELIEIMLEEEKNDLIKQNCYYESSTLYDFDENGDLLSVKSPDEVSISPFGQIKSSHLTLTITSSKSGANTVLTFNYKWKVLPLNRYQDPICIAWDRDIFYYKSNSFSKSDYYSYRIGNDPNSRLYTDTKSSESSFASGGQDYISWYADLKGYVPNMPVYDLYGYATVTLIPKKTGVSTNIYVNYVHKKTSLSLSIAYIGGFQISGLSTYDEMGAEKTVRS